MNRRAHNWGKVLKTARAVGGSKLLPGVVSAGYYNVANFGDQLTPEILSHFGVRSIHCPKFRFSDVIGVGSILHMLPSNYRGYILGAGLIDEKSAKQFPSANVLLTRGFLTQSLSDFPDSVRVGDPGLIADEIYAEHLAEQKKWDVGLVPHYRDISNDKIKKLCDSSEGQVHLIDVRRSPLQVVSDISKCRTIVASSLHGLIVADSLNIPNLWVKVSDGIIGGSFKFNDYYSCFGIHREAVTIDEITRVNQLKEAALTVPLDLVGKVKASIKEAYTEYAEQV